MENDRLNEIRELNPDYDISMHKLNVCRELVWKMN